MSENLLEDGGFETDWGDEKSHRCLIFPEGADPYEKDVGNIFTPPGWLTWFRHDPDTWDQPEVRDAWEHPDARRVYSGKKALLLFTFFRKHDAGFLQQVQVRPDTQLRLTAWAHAWSNDHGGPHPSDGRWSEGPGYEAGFVLEGDTADSDWMNFTFSLGIDPTGGTDPYADTVVWGQGAHIYNKHAQVPKVEAVAQADTVTVFLRSKTLWAFKHNDAYWDDAELVVSGVYEEEQEVWLSHEPINPRVGNVVTIQVRSMTALDDARLVVCGPSEAELSQGTVTTGRDGMWYTWTYTSPPLSEAGTHEVTFSAAGDVRETVVFDCASGKPQRGSPREQYKRTYVLLPPDAGAAWALAVVDGSWKRRRYTIGSSADDAGIGDLDARRVIAVNPERWPGDLRAFFEKYYPGVEYVPIVAASPQELRGKLQAL